ncbi:MAG TPA: VWA domain-containing protein [Bryobacteraceae bacterium]|jgi:Ca-activated chloride channel family protein|nr:VWA domain-containing protein [Bryobacteraceae bacterium]
MRAGLLSLFCASALFAQNASEPYTISDNVDMVLLDVSVRDAHGRYITGLHKDNFRVSEDGQARQITAFGSVDTPVTVGLVVDNSASMQSKRPYVTMAGLAFAQESNSHDQFFVVNFNNYIVPGLPRQVAFTDQLQQLRSALYYGEPKGQTALYDAIAYALKHLELSRFEKRTLIVVSDGGDNVSKTSLPELLKLIQASRATVYTVGLFDPQDIDRNPGVLHKLANTTGGEFFQPAQLTDVLTVFQKISHDIRNRYSIGYVPDESTNHRAVRSVKVTAFENHHKFVVRTRTTYTITPFSQLMSEQGAQ